MKELIENYLFQYECGKLLGAVSSEIHIPVSLHPWVLKELAEKHNAELTYERTDDNPIYGESQFVYTMILPEDQE